MINPVIGNCCSRPRQDGTSLESSLYLNMNLNYHGYWTIGPWDPWTIGPKDQLSNNLYLLVLWKWPIKLFKTKVEQQIVLSMICRPPEENWVIFQILSFRFNIIRWVFVLWTRELINQFLKNNKIACFKVKLSWTKGSFFVLSP